MEHWDEGYNTQKLLSITKRNKKSKEPSKNREYSFTHVKWLWNTQLQLYMMSLPWKSCSFQVNGKVGEEKFIWNERGSWAADVADSLLWIQGHKLAFQGCVCILCIPTWLGSFRCSFRISSVFLCIMTQNQTLMWCSNFPDTQVCIFYYKCDSRADYTEFSTCVPFDPVPSTSHLVKVHQSSSLHMDGALQVSRPWTGFLLFFWCEALTLWGYEES